MKPRIPKIELDEISIDDLQQMTREELDKIPYQVKKWCCQCKKCTNGTKIRDYGVEPFFFLHRKHGGWRNLNLTFLLCGKHNKFVMRVRGSYGEDEVFMKILDYSILPIAKVIDIKEDLRKKKMNELARANDLPH